MLGKQWLHYRRDNSNDNKDLGGEKKKKITNKGEWPVVSIFSSCLRPVEIMYILKWDKQNVS